MRIDTETYLAGLQCPRRLHLSHAGAPPADRAEPANDPVAALELERLREAYRDRHGDLVVPDGPTAPADLRARLEDPGCAGLADVRVEVGDAVVRIDALRRVRGGWELVCVSSPEERNAQAIDRLVFAWSLLREAGLPCDAATVARVEGADTGVAFRSHDVTGDVRFLAQDVGAELLRMRATLQAPDAPEVAPSPHCRTPRPCPHFAACTAGLDDDDLVWLPRASTAQIVAMREAGFARISDLPGSALRDTTQRRAKRALEARGLVVDAPRGLALPGPADPCAYLDFEAFAPAIPRLPGMRPYQPIALVWSLLSRAGEGRETRAHFVAEPTGDPRATFARTLVGALDAHARGLPILVYSTFEAEIVTALADHLESTAGPDREADSDALVAALRSLLPRLVDVHAVVRGAVYHPGFRGSFSLKQVVAALTGRAFYADLDGVDHGAAAAAALRDWLDARDDASRSNTSDAVRRYCARDVEALAAVHRALDLTRHRVGA